MPDVTAINLVTEEAKKVLEEGDGKRMEEVYERLTQASHQIASVLYQNAAPPEGEPAADAASDSNVPKDDDVIDAEYVDVDAEK